MANKSRASVEKVAMVQNKPAIPDQFKLIKLLELIGNDRAYTVISHKGNTWVLHFEGDYDHTIITLEGEKPEIN